MRIQIGGDDQIMYTNKTAAIILAGSVVVIGSIVGIVSADILVGQVGVVHTEPAIFRLMKKTASEVFVQGQKLGHSGSLVINMTAPVVAGDIVNGSMAAYDSPAGQHYVDVKINITTGIVA